MSTIKSVKKNLLFIKKKKKIIIKKLKKMGFKRQISRKQ